MLGSLKDSNTTFSKLNSTPNLHFLLNAAGLKPKEE